MNFEHLSFDELDEYAMTRLVYDTEELSPLLKGHLFIEKILEALLSENLVRPEIFFKRTRTFDLKLELTYSMGLMNDKYFSAFKAINKIRNNYSHKQDYTVDFNDLNGLKFDWDSTQDLVFEKASESGLSEATRVATIFLCWKAIHLVREPRA